jgi:hypothetical protein
MIISFSIDILYFFLDTNFLSLYSQLMRLRLTPSAARPVCCCCCR